MVKLNEAERNVLSFLADNYHCDGTHWCFAGIREHTKLDVKVIRRACRSLKRKGLVSFARGLWSEDGDPAGSGYGATKAGVEVFAA